MPKGANLEDIGVVPAFPEGGVGEDKACRFLKAEEPFFVFEDQIIGGDIIGKLTAALELTVHAAAGLLVDAEVALMNGGNIAAGGTEILLIGRVEELDMVIQNADILLLEDFPILPRDFVTVFIVLSVLGYLIDEEQGQGLDAHVIELLFLLKVGKDGLANLDAAHILFRHVTHHMAGMNHHAVGKGYTIPDGINL